MKINEVRNKYPHYKISYLPKKDYLKGIEPKFKVKIMNGTKYHEVFLAKNNENKYYLLYPYRNFMTGSFDNRQKAIDWFKNGGR